eukprot:Skav235828  [mRNA]  locus=scaffold1931:114640:116154:- [translate_table: standard]
MYRRRLGHFAFSRLVSRGMPALLVAGCASSTLRWMTLTWVGRRSIFDHRESSLGGNDIPLPSGTRKIRLLVDGDYGGCTGTRNAMTLLADRFPDVAVKVQFFSAPALRGNKEVTKLLRNSDVTFIPVPRVQNQVGEPNDEAIISEMQRCSNRLHGECIALFTNDKGFAKIMSQLMSSTLQFMVIIRSNQVAVADCYRENGIPVLALPSDDNCPKVRAILHSDGSGTVEFGEAYDVFARRAEIEKLYNSWEELLKGQGCSASFSSSGAYPIQRIAKFWFANCLGSLQVFPNALAVFALDAAIQEKRQRWSSNTEAFAFLLPAVNNRKQRKSAIKRFGSSIACNIFKGGGPIMLQDSTDLSAQALRKLGYLDDSWNCDLNEALNCFWNKASNKNRLRGLGLRIAPGDTTVVAQTKLRMALLSDFCDARWQCGGTATQAVARLLKSKKILPSDAGAPAMEDIWCAMKTYAQVHRLPAMKTFNGLAGQILAHDCPHDPFRRGKIVIEQ